MRKRERLNEILSRVEVLERELHLLNHETNSILEPLFKEQHEVFESVLVEFPEISRYDEPRFKNPWYLFVGHGSQVGTSYDYYGAYSEQAYTDGEECEGIKLQDIFIDGGTIEEKREAVRRVFRDFLAASKKLKEDERLIKIEKAKALLQEAGEL